MSAPVRTCLWMAERAEEAAGFYVSLLPGSRVERVVKPRADVALVDFTLAGAPFQILEARGPVKLNDAASISVLAQNQADLDRLWAALTQGGEEIACGWLRDRFGLSWQIVPRRFVELLASPDAQAVGRAMAAMEGMTKLDLAALEKAFAGA